MHGAHDARANAHGPSNPAGLLRQVLRDAPPQDQSEDRGVRERWIKTPSLETASFDLFLTYLFPTFRRLTINLFEYLIF